MDCRWVIVGPPGHIIKLTWMAFNLEESQTCSYDYLAVFDNTTIPGTGLLHPTHPFLYIWTSSPSLHHICSIASLKVVLLVSTVGTATPQIWPAQRICSLSSLRGRYGGKCVLMIWLFKTTALQLCSISEVMIVFYKLYFLATTALRARVSRQATWFLMLQPLVEVVLKIMYMMIHNDTWHIIRTSSCGGGFNNLYHFMIMLCHTTVMNISYDSVMLSFFTFS